MRAFTSALLSFFASEKGSPVIMPYAATPEGLDLRSDGEMGEAAGELERIEVKELKELEQAIMGDFKWLSARMIGGPLFVWSSSRPSRAQELLDRQESGGATTGLARMFA